MVPRESDVETYLVRRVRRIGGECFKIISPGRVGMPDRLVILPGGEVVWVEVKCERGVVSPVQQRMHKRLKELTQEVKVFWSMAQINRYFPIEEEDNAH